MGTAWRRRTGAPLTAPKNCGTQVRGQLRWNADVTEGARASGAELIWGESPLGEQKKDLSKRGPFIISIVLSLSLLSQRIRLPEL